MQDYVLDMDNEKDEAGDDDESMEEDNGKRDEELHSLASVGNQLHPYPSRDG